MEVYCLLGWFDKGGVGINNQNHTHTSLFPPPPREAIYSVNVNYLVAQLRQSQNDLVLAVDMCGDVRWKHQKTSNANVS